jgi:hypothetical protein
MGVAPGCRGKSNLLSCLGSSWPSSSNLTRRAECGDARTCGSTYLITKSPGEERTKSPAPPQDMTASVNIHELWESLRVVVNRAASATRLPGRQGSGSWSLVWHAGSLAQSRPDSASRVIASVIPSSVVSPTKHPPRHRGTRKGLRCKVRRGIVVTCYMPMQILKSRLTLSCPGTLLDLVSFLQVKFLPSEKAGGSRRADHPTRASDIPNTPEPWRNPRRQPC